jgi:protein-disulfide isomerase
MEHHETDVNRWVDERLSSLDPPGNWHPDSSAALARLRRREMPRRRLWWLWATLSATAAAACAVLLLLSTPPACADPLGCSQPAHPRSAQPVPSPAPEPAPTAIPVVAPSYATVPAAKTSFKESGSPSAKVVCDLYTDYECPYCATFYLETVPQLAARYLDTGKVRLIHRDFPLAHHHYARLAALYANAAGEVGYYREASTKLFRTQEVWSADGDVDGQVAQAIPRPAMEKVRALVKNGAALEDSVRADEALARENHVERTPTLVCNRQALAGNLTFSRIQQYLDPLVDGQ